MRVSRIEKMASREARRMSEALVRSMPPPTQWPCTAAMTGFRHRSTALMQSWSHRIFHLVFSRSFADPSPRIAAPSTRSRPAQNVLPSAWTMTTRTSGSSLNRPKCSMSPLKKSNVMQLRLSGRSRISRATCPSFSTLKGAFSAIVPPFPVRQSRIFQGPPASRRPRSIVFPTAP